MGRTSGIHPRNSEFLDATGSARAGELVRAGQLVVIPTETVYGLAADATNEVAVRAVFAAKGRPADNPLIVHVATVDAALELIPPELERARILLHHFAPGPLTVVVPAPSVIAPGVRAGRDTIAIRVPAHPVATAVIAAAGCPVAAPSANRSGRPSPTTFEMACAEMAGRVAAIVDGGACTIGIESTVVDCRDATHVTVLRPGAVTAAEIAHCLDANLTPDARVSVNAAPSRERDALHSPGTRYRHYQPTVPVVVADAAVAAAVVDRIRSAFQPYDPGTEAERSPGNDPGHGGLRIRLLTWSPNGAGSVPGVVERTAPSIAAYAASLYREFTEAERDDTDLIVAVAVQDSIAPGLADRLARAATISVSATNDQIDPAILSALDALIRRTRQDRDRRPG